MGLVEPPARRSNPEPADSQPSSVVSRLEEMRSRLARASTPEPADPQPSIVVDALPRSMSPSPQPVADADVISANRLAAVFEANPEALADLLQQLQRHAMPADGSMPGLDDQDDGTGMDVRRELMSILADRAGQADMA